jgi:glycosyltransferase involved in cell wall biosynthesis
MSLCNELVSVIVTCFNAGDFVSKAVDSAIAQTHSQLEIIVIDDGSTDDSQQLLQKYGSKIKYERQPNRGLSAARNRGISIANAKYIAFLDADDVWVKEKIELQMDLFHRHPNVGLVHTDFYFVDEQSGRCWQRMDDWGGAFVGQCYRRLFLGNQLCVSSVLVRRACLPGANPFDEKIQRPTVQDYELWLTMAKGTDFGFIDRPLVYYRKHEHNASKNMRAMIEDELYVLHKHSTGLRPLCVGMSGDTINERLHQLYFDLGCLAWNEGRLNCSKTQLIHALSYRPFHLYAWLLRIGCDLPLNWAARLRRLKQRMCGTAPISPMH